MCDLKNRGFEEITQNVIAKRRKEKVWGESSGAFQHVGVRKSIILFIHHLSVYVSIYICIILTNHKRNKALQVI